jgi:hypothetical protein
LDRMLGNAEVLFGAEVAGLGSLGDIDDLAPDAPLTLAIGTESPPFLIAGAKRIGHLRGIEVRPMVGGHVPQATHPEAVAVQLREFAARHQHDADPDR